MNKMEIVDHLNIIKNKGFCEYTVDKALSSLGKIAGKIPSEICRDIEIDLHHIQGGMDGRWDRNASARWTRLETVDG